jgi:hypothetical protein
MSEECCQVKVTRADDCLKIEIPGKLVGADASACKISICRESEGSAEDCCKDEKEQGKVKGCC